jgi:orotidine-5'-phosphate decarboxylase
MEKPWGTEADPASRLYVALDVPSIKEAEPLVKQLVSTVGAFKIGLELYAAEGPDAVRMVRANGGAVFLDFKLNDIPTTMGRTVARFRELGVKLFTVHAASSPDGMRAAAEEKGGAKALAVTVLTSMSAGACRRVFRDTPKRVVMDFTNDAASSGMDGVVCSPLELVEFERMKTFVSFPKVTPGIRPAWAPSKDDQKRSLAPIDAFRLGAFAVVVGRPITRPPDGMTPAEAAKRVVKEIRKGVKERDRR